MVTKEIGGYTMQFGFIGTGSMGKIVIESLIEAKSVLPSQIYASNRTFEKVMELAKTYTGLHAYPSNIKVAEQSDVLFLCVKPLEFKKVIDEIAPYSREDQIVVSITSPVEIKDLEKLLPAKIAKIIPSITNSAQSGASLMMAGERVSESDREYLYQLMSSISQPIWIDEQYTRVSSDIVSCGPAFMSFLLQKFIDAAVRETGISKEQATALASSMIVGMGELLAKEKFSLPSLQQRVCVPGGVTGAGIKVLEKETVDVFNKLIRETHHKYREDIQGVAQMFYEREI
jgi:competence protein ComER